MTISCKYTFRMYCSNVCKYLYELLLLDIAQESYNLFCVERTIHHPYSCVKPGIHQTVEMYAVSIRLSLHLRQTSALRGKQIRQ